MSNIYRIQLLGSILIEKEDVPIRDFESRKALALLGYLVRQNEPVSRSQLAGLFWGGKTEARGRRNLSRELSQLSNHLPGIFQTDYHTVEFQLADTYWVDTIAFVDLVESSREAGEPRRRGEISPTPLFLNPPAFADSAGQSASMETEPEKLVAAVDLYRGDFMAGFYLDDCPEFETWLVREQESWRRQVTEVLERLVVNYGSRGQDKPAETYVRRWLELEPWQENAHRYLMILLARNGKRSAALAQYEICRRALVDELAAEPAVETMALYERIRAGELSSGQQEKTAPSPTPPAPSPSVPALRIPVPSTPLINRNAELAQISEHISDPACRLLTLVGPGGIGKTRLAIQVALKLAGKMALATEEKAAIAEEKDFSHGVYYIPLDSLSSAEFLVPTIADALNFSFYSGTDPAGQLLNYLREKEMLLVLDNFEHLLPDQGADLLADILKHAPEIKILAVSRERLNLQEEYLLPIQGLGVPTYPTASLRSSSGQFSSDKESVRAGVEDDSAVQLFVQRAQAVRPDFSPSEEEKSCIIRTCQLVEGIPLAIELAAAWLRLLSCQEIAQEMEHNLDFLATSLRNVPERQRSLRAVFDYSWQLLSTEEQRVFRRLAVFRGGFQREAAEQVTATSLPLLLALTDKSLLRRSESGRYTRHVLLWQYAAQKLDEVPQEKEKVQDLHCNYYATFLQRREALLEGGKQEEALAEISAEIENIRLSWNWAIAQGKIAAIDQALESLFHFYDMRSWFQEGADMFGQAAASLPGQPSDKGEAEKIPRAEKGTKSNIILGKLLARQGWFAFQLGQHERAKSLLGDSLHQLRTAGEDTGQETAFALNYLGAVHRHLGEYAAAKRHLQESVNLCGQFSDRFGLTIALNILGQVAYLEGEFTQARQLCHESLKLKQEIGDRWGMTYSLNYLGQVALALAEYEDAENFFQESLVICREIDDRRGIANCLNHLGDVAMAREQFREAQQLYQDGLAIFQEIGNQWGITFSLTKLGNAAYAQGNYQVAQRQFENALKLAMDIRAVPAALDTLAGVATLLIETGKTEPALVVLTLLLNHPAGSRDNQDKAARLMAELEPQLPPKAIAEAQEKGQAKNLETIVQEILPHTRD